MKVSCDFSVTSAPCRPMQEAAPWGASWASPVSGTAAGLVLDFAAGAYGAGAVAGSLPDIMSFSRASAASVIDAAGQLVGAPADTARLAHDPASQARLGLLLERAANNLFADSAVPATQTVSVTATPHVLSFYGTGSVTLSGAYVSTVTGSGAYPSRMEVGFTPGAGNLTLTLSGQVQAPQLETGETATSFIPTGSPPGIRTDDNATVSLGPWFDTNAGTLVFSGYVLGANANDRIIEIDNGSAATRLSLLWNTVLGKPQLQVWNGGALQAAIAPPGNAVPLGTEFRVALACANDAFAISLNGGGVANDLSGTVPSDLTTLRLGRASGGAQGAIIAESLIYYPQRLSNAELQALSA
jgi:hypothetical protein